MALESLKSGWKPSREESARIEIGRTAVGPATASCLVGVFLVLLGAPAGVEWIVNARSETVASSAWSQLGAMPGQVRAILAAQESEAGDVRIGSRILSASQAVLASLRTFEDALDDESAVAARLRPPAQVVLTRLGAGNERVYQGRDRWLFYGPDVDYVVGPRFLEPADMRRRQTSGREWIEQPQPDPRAALVDFKRQLERRRITLIVMPTPVKPAMHPEKLAPARHGWTIPVHNPSYRPFVDDLRREGVVVFDVADALATDRERPAYLASDTHWRPETMERAAELLAGFIRAYVSLAEVPGIGEGARESSWHVEPREVSQVGDIAAMLDLPPGHRLNRPESAVIHRVLDRGGAAWRPVPSADVLVLGDSFSNVYSLGSMGWGDAAGFVEHLGRFLQRPIDRIVQNDNGAYATRARLRQEIASGSDRLRDKRVVVLQFASRELAFGDWKLIELPESGTP